MRERGKPYGKTDSCYVTEVNGNPGTGIIEITGLNHFTDLVKYIADRKAKINTVDAQANALNSYPADMIHAAMTTQQVAISLLSMVMSDASMSKIANQELTVEEVICNAGVLDLPPLTSLQQCQLANALFDIQQPQQNMLNTAKQSHALSEASAQALEHFKKINRM